VTSRAKFFEKDADTADPAYGEAQRSNPVAQPMQVNSHRIRCGGTVPRGTGELVVGHDLSKPINQQARQVLIDQRQRGGPLAPRQTTLI